jgi:sec-independent protein translocase protein TatA
MPNIGPMELILLGVLAVVIFGPAKLPEIARSLGRGVRDFKDSVAGTGVQEALDDVGGVRGAMKPTNLAKAAMPASVKQVAADVTEMKETVTDPLGEKKKAKEEAEAEEAAEQDGAEKKAPAPAPVAEAAPAERETVAAAPAPPAAPETTGAPSA